MSMPSSSTHELKRTLSLPLVTFYGIGTILGAGIYVLVGKVAGYAGMYALASFLLASILAGLSAFSYAELSARFPKSAGEAVYVEQGFHRSSRFLPENVHPPHCWSRVKTLHCRELSAFRYELLLLHSPLLEESLVVSFPPLTYMLKFRG